MTNVEPGEYSVIVPVVVVVVVVICAEAIDVTIAHAMPSRVLLSFMVEQFSESSDGGLTSWPSLFKEHLRIDWHPAGAC